jgi:hypothetical protein
MQTFPEDFSFEESQRLVEETIKNSDELSNCRKYIVEQRKKAIGNNMDYFTINLKEYKTTIRHAILLELLSKFPHIGCYYVNPNIRMVDTFLSSFVNLSIDSYIGIVKKITTTNTRSENEKFIVAMSQRAADSWNKQNIFMT